MSLSMLALHEMPMEGHQQADEDHHYRQDLDNRVHLALLSNVAGAGRLASQLSR